VKRAKKCRKCGCSERKACIEFDERGRGWPCYWVSADICSGCDSKPRLPPPPPGLFSDEEKPVPFVVAPQLAGMIARPR
jgi:hypothetical protein